MQSGLKLEPDCLKLIWRMNTKYTFLRFYKWHIYNGIYEYFIAMKPLTPKNILAF